MLLFLRQKLGEVGKTQAGMMETRLTREMEKNRSVLAKARGGMGIEREFAIPGVVASERRRSLVGAGGAAAGGLPPGEEEKRNVSAEGDLTEEQRQMFEKGNQDMLKHYESTLDKVRYVAFGWWCLVVVCCVFQEKLTLRITERQRNH